MFEKNTYFDILAFLTQNKTFGQGFYNASARLMVSISKNGGLQLSISKALDPNRKVSKSEKGSQVYTNDREQMKFFTLSPVECFKITNNIKALLDGTYSDPDPACPEQFKKILKIIHFNNGVASKLYVSKVSYKTKKQILQEGIGLSIVPASGEKGMFSLVSEECDVFLSMVENCARNNPYIFEIVQAVIKMISANSYNTINNYDSLSEKINKTGNTYTKNTSYKQQEPEPADDVNDMAGYYDSESDSNQETYEEPTPPKKTNVKSIEEIASMSAEELGF